MMTTVIFDLDGTIADTIEDLADAVNYGLRKLGCPEHDINSYKQFVGNGAMKLCIRALPEGKKDMSEKLLDLFHEYYDVHYLDKTKLYDGIKDTLDVLAANGVTLAVATNKPQDAARKIVEKLLPDVDFIKVLGGCDERPKKPDSTVINEILNGLSEDNTVYMIGDSNVDIQTAKNCGILSIGCVWGFRGRTELEAAGADFIAEKAEDITKIILR
ncbi:MAG: HAD family hydrolase [Ruminococcus sp.]|nr:HAD family hydrolase [Ruminococcus sp.]